MIKVNILNLALLIFLGNMMHACGSNKSITLNSAQKTSELQPGMSYEEVVELLGKPKSSQMTEKAWIVRWNLQEMWKGYVPYDMAFDPDTKELLFWSANEEEFQHQQEQLKQVVDALEQSGAADGGSASAIGPNDPQLMQQFAGKYYSFSSVGGGQTGGTERQIMLCPDGTFRESSETGYSAGAGTGDAWGSASQGGSRGTWRITGNMNEGTIVTVSPDGNATSYRFSRCGSDCIYFGNNKFAWAGPPDC
jgi:hypothetical protein